MGYPHPLLVPGAVVSGIMTHSTLGEPPRNLCFPSQAWGGWAREMTSDGRNEGRGDYRAGCGSLPAPGALPALSCTCSLAGDQKAAGLQGSPQFLTVTS